MDARAAPARHFMRLRRATPATRRNALALVLFLGAFVVYRVVAWWASPERMMRQFIGAVNRRDYARVIRFVDAEELRGTGITERSLPQYLDGAFAWAGGGYHLRTGMPVPFGDRERRWGAGLYVHVYDARGLSLKTRAGHPWNCPVYAYKTDAGWRIGVTQFAKGAVWIASVADERAGKPRRVAHAEASDRYRALCRSAGIRSRVFSPEGRTWGPD